MAKRTIHCAPYYFGRYSSDLERNAVQKLGAEIIRSQTETLGAVLRTIYQTDASMVVGGDCFTALPVILRRRSLVGRVLWLDAHGDYNNEITTSTGFLGGMPLAALTGQACDRILSLLGEEPIDPRACTHIGGRAWDTAEKERMVAAGIQVLSALPAELPTETHVHLDVDCFDVAEVPNVTHPAEGGLGIASVEECLVKNKRAIVSLSVSAWRVETGPPAALVRLLDKLR